MTPSCEAVDAHRRGQPRCGPALGDAGRMGEHEYPRRYPTWHPRRFPGLLVPRSVAGQVFLLQVVVAVVLVAAILLVLVVQSRQRATDEARDKSLAVAVAFRDAPGTAAAMRSAHPTRVLQPSSERMRKDAHVGYVVAFDPNGIRWSHPDPNRIGGHVTGSFGPALTGKPFQETFDSALGRAVDTTVAVFDDKGRVVGLISVGIYVRSVNEMVGRQLPALLAVAGGALLLAAAGSAVVSRRLRRQTRGLGPAEMTRMYEHHDAVLHSVREGVLIIDDRGVLTLANDEARRLLGLPRDAEQREVAGLGLDPDTTQLLVSGRTASDEVHSTADRLLAVNLRTVEGGGPDGQRGHAAGHDRAARAGGPGRSGPVTAATALRRRDTHRHLPGRGAHRRGTGGRGGASVRRLRHRGAAGPGTAR